MSTLEGLLLEMLPDTARKVKERKGMDA